MNAVLDESNTRRQLEETRLSVCVLDGFLADRELVSVVATSKKKSFQQKTGETLL